jgi:hypothetical protein
LAARPFFVALLRRLDTGKMLKIAPNLVKPWLLANYLRFDSPNPTSIGVSLSSILWGLYFLTILTFQPHLRETLGVLNGIIVFIGVWEIVIGLLRLGAIGTTKIKLRLVTLVMQFVSKMFFAFLFLLVSPISPLWWLYMFDVARIVWVYIRVSRANAEQKQ